MGKSIWGVAEVALMAMAVACIGTGVSLVFIVCAAALKALAIGLGVA